MKTILRNEMIFIFSIGKNKGKEGCCDMCPWSQIILASVSLVYVYFSCPLVSTFSFHSITSKMLQFPFMDEETDNPKTTIIMTLHRRGKWSLLTNSGRGLYLHWSLPDSKTSEKILKLPFSIHDQFPFLSLPILTMQLLLFSTPNYIYILPHGAYWCDIV